MKSPRLYAKDIAPLPTVAARRAALAKVPEHLQDLVKAHVEDYFWRKRFKPLATLDAMKKAPWKRRA